MHVEIFFTKTTEYTGDVSVSKMREIVERYPASLKDFPTDEEIAETEDAIHVWLEEHTQFFDLATGHHWYALEESAEVEEVNTTDDEE